MNVFGAKIVIIC